MAERLVKSNTRTVQTEDIQVVYNLIFKNALYSIECYKTGENSTDALNYCMIEDITEDEEDAEVFLYLMTNGKVLPVHMQDMVQDYFH